MSSKSLRGVSSAVLAAAVAMTLACSFLTGPATSPRDFSGTQASLQMQSTAMALRLTQTALANQLQPPGAPLTPQALSTPAGTQAATTATETAVVRLQPDATEISYGQRLGSYPRKSAAIRYGFKGSKGDIVSIVLVSSNARPNEPACSAATSSTTFTLETPGSQLEATNESPHLSSIKDYELPASGAYYISVSCNGGGCNGHCTEADLSLEKK